MGIQQRLYYLIIILVMTGLFFSSCKTSKKISKAKTSADAKAPEISVEEDFDAGKEREKNIQNKYAELLFVPDEVISDLSLYSFVEEWCGVPYKYAGKSKQGVDCSGFSSILYREVYHKTLTGPSGNIYSQCIPLSKEELKEGDLVFFKIGQDKISHVGIYLQNNKFVHSTTKKGVMINDLDEPYYNKYFYKAGRLK